MHVECSRPSQPGNCIAQSRRKKVYHSHDAKYSPADTVDGIVLHFHYIFFNAHNMIILKQTADQKQALSSEQAGEGWCPSLTT